MLTVTLLLAAVLPRRGALDGGVCGADSGEFIFQKMSPHG